MATKAKAEKRTPAVDGIGFKVGQAVFIRSVTNYFTGRVVAVDGVFVKLEEAAWLAQTGRYFNYLQTGVPAEVEPYPDGMAVRVGIGGIIDWCEWPHALPRSQK